MIRAELLRPDSLAWRQWLDRTPHDFYHLPAYVELSSRTTDPGWACAAFVSDGNRGMLLPLILRPISGEPDVIDAITPYGYPGPVVRPDEEPSFVAAAAVAIRNLLHEFRVISLFARLHPLLNRDCQGLECVGCVVDHANTITVDLSLSPEEQWQQTRSGHRNEINRALRVGHRAFADETWQHEQSFVRLYQATMDRVKAHAYYRFSDDYFRALREALGRNLHLWVVQIDDAIAAAGLFSECAGIVQYHLSGSDEAFSKERPTKLMIHAVRGWGCERGNRWLHLGGGTGASTDSLFRFKAGFSKIQQPFRSWRVVVDSKRYWEITSRRSGVDSDDLSGYFPAYRRPL